MGLANGSRCQRTGSCGYAAISREEERAVCTSGCISSPCRCRWAPPPVPRPCKVHCASNGNEVLRSTQITPTLSVKILLASLREERYIQLGSSHRTALSDPPVSLAAQ